MSDIINKSILAVGHSHLNALVRAYREFYGKGSTGPGPFTVSFLQLHQDAFQPNIISENRKRRLHDAIEPHFQTVVKRDQPEVIVSCVMGNEYNTVGILNHPRRFDFYLPARPDLPTDENAEILPVGLVEDLIRARLANAVGLYLGMLSRAGTHAVKVHIPPPPPVRENSYIETYPGQFGEKVRQFGVSPPFFRLKMWKLTCRVLQRLCEEAGVNFHRLPDSVFDADGFLAQPFMNRDPTHANARYGQIILDNIARTSFSGLEMEKTSERTPVQESAQLLFLGARS